jgi:hypothetical protein
MAAKTGRGRFNDGVIVAIVSGCLGFGGAILGAYVGGKTANDGAKQVQTLESERIEKRDVAATQAAARLLIGELSKVRESVLLSADDVRWHRGLDYRVDFPREDRRLLAARLSPSQWQRLSRVLGAVDLLLPIAQRNGFHWKGDRTNPKGPRDGSEDMDLAIAISRSGRAAIEALRPNAGLPTLRGILVPTQEPLIIRGYIAAHPYADIH